jgi:hypothetical protein
VLEDESRSGVVALVVGDYDILGDVVGREILHRRNLMLEWGASAHVVCRCGRKVFGGNNFESDCAIALGQLAMDVLILSFKIAVKSSSLVPVDPGPTL